MTRARLRSADGLLLIEAGAVILLMMAMTALLAPPVFTAVDDARLLRARHDLSTITVSVARMVNHVWADRQQRGGFSQFRLLVGPGAVPTTPTPAAAGWTAALGAPGVGLLNDHLIENGAPYPAQAGRGFLGWRGPYLDQLVHADPWGRRYAVNVGALTVPGLDTIVITAGPDGRIDAPFALDGGGLLGDDLSLIVSPTGRGQ